MDSLHPLLVPDEKYAEERRQEVYLYHSVLLAANENLAQLMIQSQVGDIFRPPLLVSGVSDRLALP